MARIRSIKPGFFTSEDVAALSLRARLTWIGLWTYCDDHGRAKDNTRLVRAAIWPLDDLSLEDVEDDLLELAQAGRIVRYEADGGRFLVIVDWHVHQIVSKPTPSKLPGPGVPMAADDRCSVCSLGNPGALPERPRSMQGALPVGKEGKGTGKGGRAGALPHPPTEPSPRCKRHANTDHDAPCGPCGDARRAYDAWLRAEKAKPTPTAVPDSADERCTQPGHEQYLARNCAGCRSERIARAAS